MTPMGMTREVKASPFHESYIIDVVVAPLFSGKL